jgi:Holliday junction resolvase RusA-like endonuclease
MTCHSNEWVFPISPIAASRPRISKYGAYYTGPYKKFRVACAECVYDILGTDFQLLEGPLQVDIEMYITRPKKTKLEHPRADIDNFLKAIFDVMNGKLWADDSQVTVIHASKQWSSPNELGYFTLGIN